MTMNEEDPIIKVRNLKKCYWSGSMPTPALNGVSLDIFSGDFAVLAGRSGSGKSTLLNIIGALEYAERGEVLVSGKDIQQMTADERTRFRLQQIGFVFQAFNLIRVLNARENVAYVCQLQGKSRKESREIADYWLGEVGLEDLGHRRPDQLSGGQQQRVAVARALATHPKIVLADEPTANLDTITAQKLLCLLQELNDKFATTFLISSHDPDVKNASSRLIKLADGQVMSRWSDTPQPAEIPRDTCPIKRHPLWDSLLKLLRQPARSAEK
jgi:putative ABC transport system ATP-binding protein